MAQNPKNRPRRPSRKPVTLDLKAEPAAAGPEKNTEVPEAEPVALDTPAEAAAAAAPGTAPDADERARDAVEQGAPQAGRETPPPPPPSAAAGGNRGMTALGGGVFGAIVALLLAGGLQWAGLLPAPRTGPSFDPGPLQSKIDALESEVAALISQPAGAELPAGAAESLAAATSAAQSQGETISAIEAQLGEIDQRLSSLNQTLSAAAEGGSAPAALADLDTRVSALEQTSAGEAVSALEADLSSLKSEATTLDGALGGLREEVGALSGRTEEAIDTVRQSVESLQSSVDGLEDRLASVEADIDAGAGSRVAAAIAASALKSAADRGQPFMSELESYAAVAGAGEPVEALRAYAASGVPTAPQLAERFPEVANRIVASARGLGPDAGIADRLMASARSLVQVRPVGEVAGEDPGATTARMEVALNRGDLGQALAEWENLPDEAKRVSQDFADDLAARRRLDTLISDVLSGAIDTGMPAAGGNG